MKTERALIIGFAAAVVGACHSAKPRLPETRSADRTVFTDSLLHGELCAPLKFGEDWRKVCTPKYQQLELTKPQPERQPPRVP